MGQKRSLDDVQRDGFGAAASPVDLSFEEVALAPGEAASASAPVSLSLDGTWWLAEGGSEADRLSSAWKDAVPAVVPGSVHAALVSAGRIPDPTVGTNQRIARIASTKTWWLAREFDGGTGLVGARLVFDGVCNRCSIWLNGVHLGDHEGMFGGPEYTVGSHLRARNRLVVRLEPIPFLPVPNAKENPDNNASWRKTVVFNNVYGWHYSNLPSLGIWRSVSVRASPAVSVGDPFISTVDAHAGLMDLVVQLEGPEGGWGGTLAVAVAPETFAGESYTFSRSLTTPGSKVGKHYRFRIPDPRLWWPVDLGEHSLYRLRVSFRAEDQPAPAGNEDTCEVVFGIRTVRMAPLPQGPSPALYDWTHVINGRPCFVKGTGWCTMDPLMDFSRGRYERFLKLAELQHVQMLRAWGGGMPETDDFYDLCDRFGIMVLQEWPTMGNSHHEQPPDLLEETVRRNTVRIRNHASLVMYGAGNESSDPAGPAIDMMGRLSIELDGTRPYHIAEPWGGSVHNYTCYWGREHLDANLGLTAAFIGEFGLASVPAAESVIRYLPAEERSRWPPPEDGSFAYHTPVFNTADDVSRLTQYAEYFVPKGSDLDRFVLGSQLSQAVGVRHALERARTRWPECAGVLYYKLNDNYPAASWSSVDWYGAPKIGHYVFQQSFAPLHACLIFGRLGFAGTPVKLPVFLLDDADDLRAKAWVVEVRAFDRALEVVRGERHAGRGSVVSPGKLGDFLLDYRETDSTPLLFVVDVRVEGELADRTFYWTNYEAERGCLFNLPRTTLSMAARSGSVTVRNTGGCPAVGVSVERPGHADTFAASRGCLWVDPGEALEVEVSCVVGLAPTAWNADT